MDIKTDGAKNLESSYFEAGLPEKTTEHLARLTDSLTDKLTAEVHDESKGQVISH